MAEDCSLVVLISLGAFLFFEVLPLDFHGKDRDRGWSSTVVVGELPPDIDVRGIWRLVVSSGTCVVEDCSLVVLRSLGVFVFLEVS